MRRAALFDLDRTLVRRETASLYVRHQIRTGEASWLDLARVSYWVLRYTFGSIDAEAVARKALAPLAGTLEATLSARCDAWFSEWVAPHVTDAGRHAVAHHLSRGDVVAIVTGATRYAALPLARALGIEHVVATELEVDAEGRLTGAPRLPICLAHGKLERTERLARAQGFRIEDAVFYTDSITDLPLLERVGEPVAVNPDARLRREALRRGFRIERW